MHLGKDLCLRLLKNDHYNQNIPVLATAAYRTAVFAQGKPFFKGKPWVEEAQSFGRAGLELVSITFTLAAVRVQWPTVKKNDQKQVAAVALIKKHANSNFADSWHTLPPDLQEYILKFGLDDGKLHPAPAEVRKALQAEAAKQAAKVADAAAQLDAANSV